MSAAGPPLGLLVYFAIPGASWIGGACVSIYSFQCRDIKVNAKGDRGTCERGADCLSSCSAKPFAR